MLGGTSNRCPDCKRIYLAETEPRCAAIADRHDGTLLFIAVGKEEFYICNLHTVELARQLPQTRTFTDANTAIPIEDQVVPMSPAHSDYETTGLAEVFMNMNRPEFKLTAREKEFIESIANWTRYKGRALTERQINWFRQIQKSLRYKGLLSR